MNPRKRREAKAKVKSILQQKEEMKRTIIAAPPPEPIKVVVEEPKVVFEVIEEVIIPVIETVTMDTPVYTYEGLSTVVEMKATSETEYSSDGFEQEVSDEIADDGECPVPTVEEEEVVCEPEVVDEEEPEVVDEEEPASFVELPEDPDGEDKSSKRSKKKAKKDKKAKE